MSLSCSMLYESFMASKQHHVKINLKVYLRDGMSHPKYNNLCRFLSYKNHIYMSNSTVGPDSLFIKFVYIQEEKCQTAM